MVEGDPSYIDQAGVLHITDDSFDLTLPVSSAETAVMITRIMAPRVGDTVIQAFQSRIS